MTASMMPKRKRSDTVHSSLTPLDIAAVVKQCQDMDNDSGGGGSSPRTKVAERFQTLNIEAPASSPVLAETLPEAERVVCAPKKRTKRNISQDVMGGTNGPMTQQQDGPATPPPSRSRKTQVQEIGETPGCYARYPSSPPVSPSPKKVAFTARLTASAPTKIAAPTPVAPAPAPAQQPHLSPPPPTPITTPIDAFTSLPARTIYPLGLAPPSMPVPSQDQDSTPDTSTLFWQDTEITGHEIDSSRDDDGTGINGLGFRLTPAMAYARSEKRKQQVSEWRAREAKEARQRRFNRRRGENPGADRVEGARRAVRFAEV